MSTYLSSGLWLLPKQCNLICWCVAFSPRLFCTFYLLLHSLLWIGSEPTLCDSLVYYASGLWVVDVAKAVQYDFFGVLLSLPDCFTPSSCCCNLSCGWVPSLPCVLVISTTFLVSVMSTKWYLRLQVYLSQLWVVYVKAVRYGLLVCCFLSALLDLGSEPTICVSHVDQVILAVPSQPVDVTKAVIIIIIYIFTSIFHASMG